MKITVLLTCALLSPLIIQGVGYDDTPVLPDSKWRVHDKARPNPDVVVPGQDSAPPSDAVVLFDGTHLDAWNGGPWRLVDGVMEVNGKGSISTKEQFGDCQLHIEWASPAEVKGDSQGRGNSGVYLMGRYEVQILDSHDNKTYADGQAAAIYGQRPPDVNTCRGPGQWQAFDILFRAPRFEEDELVSPAVITVLHNGVVVHNAVEIIGAAAHARVGTYQAHPPEGPIQLQDHGDPVRFRNIWIRRL